MLTTFLLSLLVSKILSTPLNSCELQSDCLSVEYEYGIETVNICIKFNNKLGNCSKDERISYACYSGIESEKTEGFNSNDIMCIEAPCNADEDERFVEFGFKDGRECTDDTETSVSILGAFDDVQCRAADRNVENGVLCGGGAKKECIHKIKYDSCTSPETPISSPGNVPKCLDQSPCLQINYDDSMGDGIVRVCVTYDGTRTGCAKGNEPLSHICYPSVDGTMVREDGFDSGSQKCVVAHCKDEYVEMAFADGQGCDDQNTIVNIEDENGIENDIECKSAVETNFCGDNGNEKQCIYQIPIVSADCGQFSESALTNNKHNNENVFGIENASNSTTIGIFTVIIIGVMGFIGIVSVFVWLYICKKKSSINREMVPNNEDIELDTPTINPISLQSTATDIIVVE